MTNEHYIVSTDSIDRDRYTSSQTRERTLNAAIIQANISEGFEEYLEIYDEFYADDVEAGSETGEELIRGKARVRSFIANFLVPLHVMAEIGGLVISIRQTAIPGDAANETHSYEYHYDHQQSGGPLTSNDLNFNAATSAAGFLRPS